MDSSAKVFHDIQQRGTALNFERDRGWFSRVLARCFGYRRADPVPAHLAEDVTVLGIPNARFWADSQGAALATEALKALEREKRATGKIDREPSPAYFLATSGGSDDGAFGAGLI